MKTYTDTAHRYASARHNGASPSQALAAARADAEKPLLTRWPQPFRPPSPTAPGAPFHGGLRWIEQPSAAGLRFVDEAHRILRLSYTGWLTDPEGMLSECARGAVFQLPGRNRAARYVAGVLDPFNDGAAAIDCAQTYTAKEDAAHAADSAAELFAEREREYNEIKRARFDYDDLRQSIKRARQVLLFFCQERKTSPRLIAHPWREFIAAKLRHVRTMQSDARNLAQKYSHAEAWNC